MVAVDFTRVSFRNTYWYCMIMNWLAKTEHMDDKHHCGHMAEWIFVNFDLGNDLLTDGANVTHADLSSYKFFFWNARHIFNLSGLEPHTEVSKGPMR